MILRQGGGITRIMRFIVVTDYFDFSSYEPVDIFHKDLNNTRVNIELQISQSSII